MNGIEFLEQAMDLFPGARRALLTAYADTNAAIDAINVVDVDNYFKETLDRPGPPSGTAARTSRPSTAGRPGCWSRTCTCGSRPGGCPGST